MHAEYYVMRQDAASVLNHVKQSNGRIISVGTTSTRVLETIVQKNHGESKAASGWTDIYIYPPYKYQAIDGLITNVHLTKSTLLILISAMADRVSILKA